jgi:hypothetical protein
MTIQISPYESYAAKMFKRSTCLKVHYTAVRLKVEQNQLVVRGL